jgi:hypothetical protein
MGTVFNDQWTRMELLEVMRRLLTCKLEDTAFCFFIDGLDEYLAEIFDLI